MTGWWTDSADLVNILIIVDWTQIFWVYIKLLSNQITIFSNQITIFSNQIDKYSWWKKQTNKQTNDSPMNRLQLAGCRLKMPETAQDYIWLWLQKAISKTSSIEQNPWPTVSNN